MARHAIPSNFADVLTISEAADFLGVSTATLRNWDRSGKLKPRRHPQNGYRIYLHEDLAALLRSADLSASAAEAAGSPIDWSSVAPSDHFVQFYESDEFLIQSASGFIAAALRTGDRSIMAMTPEHCAALRQSLAASGIDVAEAETAGRFVMLDARETLAQFMTGRSIERERFDEGVGGAIGRMLQGGRRLHACGEMVALLWTDGNREAAIQLEQLWDDLARQHKFALLCAYPIAIFGTPDQGDSFQEVCSCHSRVIPAESYSAVDCDDKRSRNVSVLQQRSRSLDAEIIHRREIEKLLATRDRQLAQFITPKKDQVSAISKSRILVVDDNQDSAHTLSLLLKIKGHEVVTAGDGLEALAVAEEFRPDIVLMDVGMPKLDGYEATRRLRETSYGNDIMIVALTGWGQPDDVARSIDAGCTAHVVKPVDFAELERLLATVNA
jgi:CheY-like chemotaxis protein